LNLNINHTQIILYALLILFSMNVLLFWLDIYEDEITSKPANEHVIEGWWGRKRKSRRCSYGSDRWGRCNCRYARDTNGRCMSYWQLYWKRRKEQRVKRDKFNVLNRKTKVDIQNKKSFVKSLIMDLEYVNQNQ